MFKRAYQRFNIRPRLKEADAPTGGGGLEASSSVPGELPHDQVAIGRPGYRERILTIAIILSVLWIAHFSLFMNRGLYEDDYAFISPPLGWTSTQLAQRFVDCFATWPQGRPIGFSLAALFAFVGGRLGGIAWISLISCLLHFANALIFHGIVRQRLSAAPALAGALAFVLFPSDTSTALLTNGLFGSLTVLFLVLALWLYAKQHRVSAYVVSLGSLLTYESAFLPFFAAPLLRSKSLRQTVRELLRHWAILIAMGGSLFYLRLQIGEEKAVQINTDGIFTTFQRILTAIFVGPLTTIRLFVSRLFSVVESWDQDALLVVILMTVVLAPVFLVLKVVRSDELRTWPVSIRIHRLKVQADIVIDKCSAHTLQFAVCGMFMLVLAYGLAITRWYFPPVIDAGRLTFVHLAAAVGSGVLFGSLSSMLLDIGDTLHKKIFAGLVIAIWLSGLAGFHFIVQQDFESSWKSQRTFWKNVVDKSPDISDGTIILYESDSSPSRYVLVNSWADPLILRQIFDFPPTWQQPPRLFQVSKNWTSDVTTVDEKLIWKLPSGPWEPYEVFPTKNVIILREGPKGELQRVVGLMNIGPIEFMLKPSSEDGVDALARGPLYDVLISD